MFMKEETGSRQSSKGHVQKHFGGIVYLGTYYVPEMIHDVNMVYMF